MTANAAEPVDRMTAWSVKTDIWSVGVTMHYMLLGEFPKAKIGSLAKRVEKLGHHLTKRRTLNDKFYETSPALIKIICECLDPEPQNRVSALDILAISLKSDISELGIKRSATFWKSLLKLPRDPNGEAAATVRHFVSSYLEMIDDAPFSAAEVCCILTLVSMYMNSSLQVAVSLLNGRLYGELKESSVFHALAIATSEDQFLYRLIWEETSWPTASGLALTSLLRNKAGYLPSVVALMRGSVPVFKLLNSLE